MLFEREIGGFRKCRRNPVNPHVFHKLPGRLAFPLPNLVDHSTLQDGHVFLGFTKSGQFLLSYSQSVEADEHTAYPIYVYRLQWWRFIPYRRLRKIAEVRLFGEEEIEQDVYIMVSEWPRDNSRIIIHGYCAPNENEEKHQCYITVTAIPSIDPCDDCNQLAILHMHNRYQYEAPPRCLNHAFTVHTKYDLAPPYPAFCPKVFLKLDGVVVINTGDSLIAISVDIEDNHGGFGFGLFSPRVCRTLSTLSSLGSPSDDQFSADSHENRISDTAREHLDLLGRFIASSPNSAVGVYKSPPPAKESRSQLLKERPVLQGKENQMRESVLCKNLASPPPPAFSFDAAASSQNKVHDDIYNFDDRSPPPKKEEDTSEFYEVVTDHSKSGRPVSIVRSSITVSAQISRNQTPNTSESPLEGSSDKQKESAGDQFEKPTLLPTRHSKDTSNTPSRSFSGLSLIPPLALDGFSLAKSMSSPGCKFDTASSTCSSCISAPIIVQSDSQCFTYSVRRYVESYAFGDGPIDMEDDLNLAYHSVLPLEVHGANNGQMRLLTKQCSAPQMPCIVVKQLTLDIEHYLGEAVRTRADWGHRYLSFTNYDVQIVDVCAETAEVIALVFVLIRARPPKDKSKPYIHGRSVPRLYQSGLKMLWNLRTGSYNTIDVDDLKEINQADFMRKRKQWHPGTKVCEQLFRKYAVPQLFSNSVNVHTNEPVFKGQSLKMIIDRQNYAAILL